MARQDSPQAHCAHAPQPVPRVQHVEQPVPLDQEFGARLARGTVGIRLPIERFVCKVKLSQDKDPGSQRGVHEALQRPGPYQNEALASDMKRELM